MSAAPIPSQTLSPKQRLARILRGHPYEIVLGVGLFAFFLYKLGDLTLPYFWDELGVYGRAAVYLHDHKLGLLPANLPPELSRGHPLLLVFLAASLFRVFGASTTVAHVFVFFLAVSLLVSVFWIARAHWNAKVGLAAAALLAVQPLFLAQSTLLLPELPLALAVLWTMASFHSRRYWLGGICLALAIFVKETALVLGPVLGLMVLADWIRSRPSWKTALWGFLALIGPALLYGLFLLIQKRQNGWYFFPLHESHMDFHWPAMKGKLIDYCNFVFIEQGRYPLSVIVSLWAVFRLVGKRDSGRRFQLGIGWIFALFAIVLIVFSSGNFFMKRYLLCLL
ncbi:MAG TPA: glycosyltransferase family 39 protein, partial [Polyangia bacterium]